MPLTEQEIIAICTSRVDITKLTANNYSLCIDGTSCTKKSSILRVSQRMVSKNQRLNPNNNSDTFFPSMIGYITSGIANLTCGGPHFEDRSPLNVLDWHILWKIFDDYLKHFGNVLPDENNAEMAKKLEMYKSIFDSYKEWYIYKLFAVKINTIALIDSNIARCDNLRFTRGESSDCERSLWNFYTSLQNLMYRQLYDGLYIDLDWFGDSECTDVVNGIAKFLNSTLDSLAQRPNLDYAPLVNRQLPTVKCDYTMENITTHAYRSIGRHGCQILIGNTDEVLKSRLPSYLNVSHICNPLGGFSERIVSTTRDYLLNCQTKDESMVEGDDVVVDLDCSMDELF
ncbi:GrBNV gp44-like protein [Tomelloso virus]|uniref:GrBNV gp44-like protein n=1 Tax=Tomelloso virus TaxID=2053981 RepID=A0A2H4T2Q8_9VIRU|nr:GrBNV gp44-like protein [Tomelloso virus]ATY70213.1 GrBNV gp44-like protein [Tomelloso virus]